MKREELKSIFDALRNDPQHHLGLGDIRLTIAQQDEILAMFSPLPPAEGAEDDDEIILGEPDKLNLQWSGYGVLGNCKQRQQPTSEGAEEIHNIEAMQKCLHRYVNVDEVNRYDTLVFGAMRDYADDFVTLHAQKIADKMVSERLREELGKFIKWYNSGYEQARKPHLIVKEYLKSRDSHE